ncbi:hypothetical protein KI387_043022, partial [Taxus chinensis]
MEAQGEDDGEMEDVDLSQKEKEYLDAIRKNKKMFIEEHKFNKITAKCSPIVPRNVDKDREYNLNRMGRHLSSLGLDPSVVIQRSWNRSMYHQ